MACMGLLRVSLVHLPLDRRRLSRNHIRTTTGKKRVVAPCDVSWMHFSGILNNRCDGAWVLFATFTASG